MDPETHVRIVREAIGLLNENEIKRNARLIIYGSFNEDFYDIFRFRFGFPAVTHFYNPNKGKGLWFFKSAKKKGTDYFQRAVRLYKKGSIEGAFRNLGRCAHLLADVATPSHTNIRTHYVRRDALEEYASESKMPNDVGVADEKEEVSKYFEELARLSYNFGTFNAKHLTNESRKLVEKQFDILVRKAIAQTAALLKHFMREVAYEDSKKRQ